MQLVTIPLSELIDGRRPPDGIRAREWCAQLEAGDILLFPQTPIPIPQTDLEFLLGQQQTESRLHKNIAYRPAEDKVTGLDEWTDSAASDRLRRVMGEYSHRVVEFLSEFLDPYQRRWKLDYASFRPQEEEGRDLPVRKRNDLLHTDAFPTRPTQGARILRFFNNINPTRTRDWVTTDTFQVLAGRFAPKEISLPAPEGEMAGALRGIGRTVGLGAAFPALKRSPYDDFMMRFHNFLKENEQFQKTCAKHYWEFPPGASWMVYTDTVSHAVLGGQYALEQTLLIAPEAMVHPEVSPLGVLERMVGAKLV